MSYPLLARNSSGKSSLQENIPADATLGSSVNDPLIKEPKYELKCCRYASCVKLRNFSKTPLDNKFTYVLPPNHCDFWLSCLVIT